MANITASDVNKLRQLTGVGMMDCKKALVECDGDFDKAIDFLRQKGQKMAAKRADRDANEGCVLAKTNGNMAAMVMVSCETDFVATNEGFVAFTRSILDNALAKGLKTKDEVLAMTIDGSTVADLVTDQIAKIGEKIELAHYEVVEAPAVYSYVHPGNRMGGIIGMNKPGFDEAGHNLVMQVVAMRPIAIDEESVAADVVEKELAIAKEKTVQELIEKAVENALKKAGINPAHVDSDAHIDSNTAKGWITPEQAAQAREIKTKVAEEEAAKIPAAKVEAIAKGRLGKFFKENTLVNQEYIMESKVTVKDFIANTDKELKVTGFKRLELGA